MPDSHLCTAILTLVSRFPLWTASSISVTTSLLNALAVSTIRASQDLPFCIPVILNKAPAQCSHQPCQIFIPSNLTYLGEWSFITFQYCSWKIFSTWSFKVRLAFPPDIPPIFILMSRLNWSNLVNTAITGTLYYMLNTEHNLYDKKTLYILFLSGQMEPKNFMSRTGRSFSIGMQYLNIILACVCYRSTWQTRLHATYSLVGEHSPSHAQSVVPLVTHLRSQPRIHMNHGKCIRHDWRTQARPWYCDHHACRLLVRKGCYVHRLLTDLVGGIKMDLTKR